MKPKKEKKGETCSSCIDNVFSRVPNAQDQSSSRGTVRGIKIREGHFNAAQPNLSPHRIRVIKNYTNIHWDCSILRLLSIDKGNMNAERNKEEERTNKVD